MVPLIGSEFVCRLRLWKSCGLSILVVFFFQAEDGIRDLVRSRGLGDVYKRQSKSTPSSRAIWIFEARDAHSMGNAHSSSSGILRTCLLYTSDAADERSSVDLGGRRIIKKKKKVQR